MKKLRASLLSILSKVHHIIIIIPEVHVLLIIQKYIRKKKKKGYCNEIHNFLIAFYY